LGHAKGAEIMPALLDADDRPMIARSLLGQ
jgi:hypothetical protein